jgi:hypothetical protein
VQLPPRLNSADQWPGCPVREMQRSGLAIPAGVQFMLSDSDDFPFFDVLGGNHRFGSHA